MKTMQASNEEHSVQDLMTRILREGNYDPKAPRFPENKRYGRRMGALAVRMLRECNYKP